MSTRHINRVILTANLTADPELRALPSGTSVAKLRVAVNSRKKDASGEWVDKPGYYNVSIFGAQAEACGKYLSKGKPVAIDGRLDWHEWEDKDTGGKRSAVEIVADTVQFLGGRDDAPAAVSDVPSDFQSNPANAPAPDDGQEDIPF